MDSSSSADSESEVACQTMPAINRPGRPEDLVQQEPTPPASVRAFSKTAELWMAKSDENSDSNGIGDSPTSSTLPLGQDPKLTDSVGFDNHHMQSTKTSDKNESISSTDILFTPVSSSMRASTPVETGADTRTPPLEDESPSVRLAKKENDDRRKEDADRWRDFMGELEDQLDDVWLVMYGEARERDPNIVERTLYDRYEQLRQHTQQCLEDDERLPRQNQESWEGEVLQLPNNREYNLDHCLDVTNVAIHDLTAKWVNP